MKTRLFFALFLAFLVSFCSKKEPITPSPCDSQCALVPDDGPCEAYKPKYYYDQNEKKCKEFIWGGCGGTVPFETLEECLACRCK